MVAESDSQIIRLVDGREFLLRPLQPGDLDALRRAFRRLTPEEVELRFLHLSRELPAFIENEVRELDPACDSAFVLEHEGEIRAVADLHVERSDRAQAEFGLIVGQAVAGHGLGRLLMERLLMEARRRGSHCTGAFAATMRACWACAAPSAVRQPSNPVNPA